MVTFSIACASLIVLSTTSAEAKNPLTTVVKTE